MHDVDARRDVVGNDAGRVPRWAWAVLVLLLATGVLGLWLSTQEDPADPDRRGAASASVSPSPSPSPSPSEALRVDACREAILAINSATEASLGTFPPLSASALASVEQAGQTLARMTLLLRPAERQVADDASEAMNALILGDLSTDPLGTLLAASPALASACTS